MNTRLATVLVLGFLIFPSPADADPTFQTLVEFTISVHKKLIGIVDKDWLDAVEARLKASKGAQKDWSSVLEPQFGQGKDSFLYQAADDLKRLKGIYALALPGEWNRLEPEMANLSLKPTEGGDPNTFTLSGKLWESFKNGHSNLDQFIKVLREEIDRLHAEINRRYETFKSQVELAAN